MTTKQTHSSKITTALAARASRIDEQASTRERSRDGAGKYLAKVSEAQWEWALDQIGLGNTDANIARHLNIHPATIVAKRHADPEFAQRYNAALEAAFIQIAQDTRSVARGVEGFSTGDVRRDELVVATDLKLAKAFANRIFGDKIQVDQRQIVVNIRNDEADW